MNIMGFDLISLLVGLVVGAVLMMIKSMISVRAYKKELEDYKKHLERQMKLTQDGVEKLTKENEKLKKENENLRINVKTLSQKPGRSELRLLNIYDLALRKMNAKAPGFAQGWEMALQEAEREYEENEVGLKSVIKKVFSPGITHKVIDTEADESK